MDHGTFREFRAPVGEKPTPCKKDCPGRDPYCHGKCLDYISWKKEHEKIKEERRLEKEVNAQLNRTHREKIDRFKKEKYRGKRG